MGKLQLKANLERYPKQKMVELKNKEFSRGFLIGICSAIILIGLIYLSSVYFSKNPVSSELIISPKEVKEIINKCSNNSLFNSAECVQKITKTFYKYNLSQIDKNIDFEILKINGGVCEDWALYWCLVGEEIGFYTEEVRIDTGTLNFTYNGEYGEYEIRHMFCIWSDESGYIIADGNTVHYFKFEDG